MMHIGPGDGKRRPAEGRGAESSADDQAGSSIGPKRSAEIRPAIAAKALELAASCRASKNVDMSVLANCTTQQLADEALSGKRDPVKALELISKMARYGTILGLYDLLDLEQDQP